MDILQKNVFGDNVIYQITSPITRELTADLKIETLKILQSNGVKSVIIRYENGGEASEFSAKVRLFLIDSGFSPVNTLPIIQSEIPRGEFSIFIANQDKNWAIIQIGPIY